MRFKPDIRLRFSPAEGGRDVVARGREETEGDSSFKVLVIHVAADSYRRGDSLEKRQRLRQRKFMRECSWCDKWLVDKREKDENWMDHQSD